MIILNPILGLISWFNRTDSELWQGDLWQKFWALMLVFVAVYVAYVLFNVLFVIYRKIYQLTHRKHCQHDWCEHQWTLRIRYPDQPEANCTPGAACCSLCRVIHQADAEPQITCPKTGCGSTMMKIIERTVIYDRCPTDGTICLDHGELQQLREYSAAGTESNAISNWLLPSTVIGMSSS